MNEYALRHRIRVHLANRHHYSHSDFCIKLEEILAERSISQPAQQVPAGSIRLWDAQWVSIVNHDNAYNGWSTNDAVNHAVRMTERYIAANVAQNNLPPLPAAQEVKP